MNVFDFFSSPIGLGHVTRDIAIVNNFENISTNFVTGSGAEKILKKLDLKVQDVYNQHHLLLKMALSRVQQNGYGVIINIIKIARTFHRKFSKRIIQI